jgi:hypothetical protein
MKIGQTQHAAAELLVKGLSGVDSRSMDVKIAEIDVVRDWCGG